MEDIKYYYLVSNKKDLKLGYDKPDDIKCEYLDSVITFDEIIHEYGETFCDIDTTFNSFEEIEFNRNKYLLFHCDECDRIYQVTKSGLKRLNPSLWAKIIKYLGGGLFGTISNPEIENSGFYNNLYSLNTKEIYTDGYTDIWSVMQLYRGPYIWRNATGINDDCDFSKINAYYVISPEVEFSKVYIPDNDNSISSYNNQNIVGYGINYIMDGKPYDFCFATREELENKINSLSKAHTLSLK